MTARFAASAAMATLAATALSIAAAAAMTRGGKTLFRGQPLAWEPELQGSAKVEPITIVPAWTFSGLRAPLAGDPVALDGHLLAAAQDGTMVSLDGLGAIRWSLRLDTPLAIGPAAGGGTLFQATRGGDLVAISAADGRILWRLGLGSEALFPPLASSGRLLVMTAGQDLLAVDAAHGSLLARRALPGRPTSVPEPAPGNLLLVGTEHGMVLALAAGSLEVRWRRYLRQAITSPLLEHRGRVYAATADRRIACLRLTSGRVLWRARTGAIVGARPFVLGRWLYALCFDDDIYVLSARRGHLLGRVRMGHRLVSDGALSAGHLFVAPDTEGALHGLALPGLQSAGKFMLGMPGEWFTTGPVVLGERLVIGYGRTEGRLLVLDVEPAPPAAPQGPQAPPGSPAPGASPP